MRNRSRTSPLLWTGSTGKQIRSLGRDAQVVAFYLFTSPGHNAIGLYYLPLPTLCHEIGMSEKAARKTLAELSTIDFAHYDDDTESVWVTGMAKQQLDELDERDHLVKWVRKMAEQARRIAAPHLFNAFLDRYRDSLHLDGIAPVPASPSQAPSEALGKPLASPREGGAKPLASPTATATATATAGSSSPGRGGLGETRRRRVPDDFALSPELEAFAAVRGFTPGEIAEELAKFRDYEFGTPRSDWPACWRTWVRNAEKFRQRDGARGNRSGRGQHAADRTMDAIHEAFGSKP